MIRNVVLGRLPADADDNARAVLDQALRAIAGLRYPGLIETRLGLDAGLRDGGWTFAITNDWEDVDSYRAYDADPEHNVHRARIAEVAEQLARVQFETPAG